MPAEAFVTGRERRFEGVPLEEGSLKKIVLSKGPIIIDLTKQEVANNPTLQKLSEEVKRSFNDHQKLFAEVGGAHNAKVPEPLRDVRFV